MATNHTNEDLRIMSWNANGIKTRAEDLAAFIKKEKIPVIAIQETKLTSTNSLFIPNYTIYRSDKNGYRRGIALLVSTTLDHQILNIPILNTLETIGIEVTTTQGKINIFTIYIASKKPFPAADLEQILDTQTPTILMGDWNAVHRSWGHHCTTTKGNQLLQFTRTNLLQVLHPSSATRITTSSSTTLDFTIAKNFPPLPNPQTLQIFTSDHLPILQTLPNLNPTHKLPNPRIFSTNWEKFSEALQNELTPNITAPCLENKEDIDNHIAAFTEIITTSYKLASKSSMTTQNKTNSTLPPYILELIKNRSKLRKIWHITRDLEDKHQYCKATNLVKTEIQKYRNHKWSTYVNNLQSDNDIHHKNMWRTIKSLQRTSKTSAPIISNSRIIHNAQDKANLFADHLADIMNDNNLPTSNLEEEIATWLKSAELLPHPPPPPKITKPELLTAICLQQNRKAPGPDGITAIMIKKAIKIPEILNYILIVFNACLTHNYFPINWKKGNVILFPKPGKPTNEINNYRPITLLSILGKIFERIILRRLQTLLKADNNLRNEQFGFRNRTATTHQILRLTEQIAEGLHRKKSTQVLFLDISRAFDRVWHSGLLYKISYHNLPWNYLLLIKSFLQDRTIAVKISDAISENKSITSGVPQGAVLSPILFNIYVNDFPTTTRTTLYMYADDTAVATQCKNRQYNCLRLNNCLRAVAEWSEKWKITINPAKSTTMEFSARNKPDQPIYLNNTLVPTTQQQKFLGVIFDRRLTWTAHTSNILKRVNNRIHALQPIIGPKSPLYLKTKKQIYNAVVLPIFTYGIEVYYNQSQTNKKRLERQHNQALHLITNTSRLIPSYEIHNALNTKTISDIAKQRITKFHRKLNLNENPLIKTLYQKKAKPNKRRFNKKFPSNLIN